MDDNIVEDHMKNIQSNDHVKKHSRFQNLWSQVTLEPMWLGIGTSFMISVTSFKNLFLERACLVDLGYAEEMCLRSEGDQKLAVEFESQKVLSSIMVTSGFITNAFTFVMVLFLAPWSDSCGRRKPLIVMSILGSACSTAALLIVLVLPQLSASWSVYLHGIPTAIGGHMIILTLAGFNYLGDICYKTGRCTLSVIGKNMAFMTIALTLGAVLGPLVYRWLDFVGLFSLCLLLEMFSLIYAILTIKDVNVVAKIPKVFDLKLPWRAVQCFFRKREGHRRRNIILMTVSNCSACSIAGIEFSLIYMYLRNKFAWTEVEYGALLTLRNVLAAVGSFVIVGVLKKKMQMKENHIGILGGISHVLVMVTLMASNTTLMIYCTSITILFSRAVMIAEIPVINKQIVANEQGKIGCVKTLLALLCLFLVVPLSNQLYRVTLDWFPDAFLLVNLLMSVLQILCYALVRENDVEVDMGEEKMRPSENCP